MKSLFKVFILALIFTANFKWIHGNEDGDGNSEMTSTLPFHWLDESISNESSTTNEVKSKRD